MNKEIEPTKHEVKKSTHSDVWLVNLEIKNKLLGITVAKTEKEAIEEWKKAKIKYAQQEIYAKSRGKAELIVNL